MSSEQSSHPDRVGPKPPPEASPLPDKDTKQDPAFHEGGGAGQVFHFNRWDLSYGTDDKGHAAAIILSVLTLLLLFVLIIVGAISDRDWMSDALKIVGTAFDVHLRPGVAIAPCTVSHTMSPTISRCAAPRPALDRMQRLADHASDATPPASWRRKRPRRRPAGGDDPRLQTPATSVYLASRAEMRHLYEGVFVRPRPGCREGLDTSCTSGQLASDRTYMPEPARQPVHRLVLAHRGLLADNSPCAMPCLEG